MGQSSTSPESNNTSTTSGVNEVVQGLQNHPLFQSCFTESTTPLAAYEAVFKKFQRTIQEIPFWERWQYFLPADGSESGLCVFNLLMLFQSFPDLSLEAQKINQRIPGFTGVRDKEYPVSTTYNNLWRDLKPPDDFFNEGEFYVGSKKVKAGLENIFSGATAIVGLNDFIAATGGRNRELNEKQYGLRFGVSRVTEAETSEVFQRRIVAIVPFMILPSAPPPRRLGAWHTSLLIVLEGGAVFFVNSDGAFQAKHAKLSAMHTEIGQPSFNGIDWSQFFLTGTWDFLISEVPSDHFGDLFSWQGLATLIARITQKKYIESSIHIYRPFDNTGGVWEKSDLAKFEDVQRVYGAKHLLKQAVTLNDLAAIQVSFPYYSMSRRNCMHLVAVAYAMMTGHVMNLPDRASQVVSYVALCNPDDHFHEKEDSENKFSISDFGSHVVEDEKTYVRDARGGFAKELAVIAWKGLLPLRVRSDLENLMTSNEETVFEPVALPEGHDERSRQFRSGKSLWLKEMAFTNFIEMSLTEVA